MSNTFKSKEKKRNVSENIFTHHVIVLSLMLKMNISLPWKRPRPHVNKRCNYGRCESYFIKCGAEYWL